MFHLYFRFRKFLLVKLSCEFLAQLYLTIYCQFDIRVWSFDIPLSISENFRIHKLIRPSSKTQLRQRRILSFIISSHVFSSLKLWSWQFFRFQRLTSPITKSKQVTNLVYELKCQGLLQIRIDQKIPFKSLKKYAPF